MTRIEMIESIRSNPGIMFTHKLFGPDEYIWSKRNGRVYDENGLLFEDWNSDHNGIRMRNNNEWETEWSVYHADLTKEIFENLVYELYKINWLECHTTYEMRCDKVYDYYDEMILMCPEAQECIELDDYIEETGYDTGFYACKEEFLLHEYRDRVFMQSLLSEKMFANYLKLMDGDDISRQQQ